MKKVSVIMMTYNHESFIKEAIEGVLIQECDFEVELIIANDKSPDKTDEVVLDLIKHHKNGHWINYTKHKVNKGIHYNFIWATKQCQGKYIAICEGDDYWIDPLKLRKQVDFLEKNEEYGVVHTDNHLYYQDTNQLIKSINKERDKNFTDIKNIAEGIILGNYEIHTLTSLFRNSLIQDKVDFNSFHKYKMGDLPLWLTLSQHTRYHYLDEPTAVYRRSQNTASNPSNIIQKLDFQISSKEVRYIFAEKFNLSTKIIEKASDNYNRTILRKAFEISDSNMASVAFSNLNKKTKRDTAWYLGSKNRVLKKILIKLK